MSDWKIALSIGCLILGLFIALQFKEQEKEGFPLAAYRPDDLIRMLKESDKEKNQLQSEVQALRTHLEEYESTRTKKGDMARVLAKELQRTRLEAGLTRVNGPGVEVVLDDSKKRIQPGEDDYFYLVHDVDLNQLVNELWAIGAEAIGINDQRVVVNSAIRCVGPTILVNTTRLSPPYHVIAIGDPDTLSAGLKMRGGFLNAMSVSRAHGVQIYISKEKRISIPAYNGVTAFRYAFPEKH